MDSETKSLFIHFRENLSPIVLISQQWTLMISILQKYAKQDLLRIIEVKWEVKKTWEKSCVWQECIRKEKATEVLVQDFQRALAETRH